MMRLFLSTVFFFAFVAAALITRGQTVNILNNGGFENGESGWSGWYPPIEVINTDFHTGSHCVKFNGNGTLEQSPILVVPGKTYKLSAWIRINNMTGSDWGGIRFSAIEYNWSAYYSSDFYTLQNRPQGVWFQEIVTFTPSTTQVRVQIGFFGGSSWSPEFSFDEVILTEEPVINAGPVIDSLRLVPQSGSVPLAVTGTVFAHDPDGVIDNYHIDFGDGAVNAGSASFSHIYRIPGHYTLSLTVTDDVGAIDTLSIAVTATGTISHSVSVLSPSSGSGSLFTTTGEQVTVTGTRSGGSGDIFWINERTMQSGYEPVVADTFRITAMKLSTGKNKISIQSFSSDGTIAAADVTVFSQPPGYSGPVVTAVSATLTDLGKYERTDVTFSLKTIAENLFFPYDTLMPGHTGTGTGVTVDMVFTRGTVVKRQPAFLNMAYLRDGSQLLPSGEWTWTVRMAFRETGTWTSQIIATDAGGTTLTNGPLFTVVPDSLNKGYIRVSATDNRYFEYDDGQPFIAAGHGTAVSGPDQSDAETNEWKANNLTFGRFWLSGSSPFSDSWSSWATHHPMTPNGYMPPPLLTYGQHYGSGDFSYRLAAPAIENVNTPAIFRGFWDGSVCVKPLTQYQITARVKTINITGNGGLVIKTGGWLGTGVVNPGIGTLLSGYLKGDNPWGYLIGNITTGSTQHSLDYLYLVLEDCAGEAFLDQLTIQEVNPDGSLKENILSKWNANSHEYLDPIRCRNADYLIDTANRSDIHYKIVIFEKNDYICNHIDRAGLVSPNKGSFEQPQQTRLHRLYEYYWRNLIARWGYATSVHSWELVNEGAPGSYFDLTNDLADYCDTRSPYPRMVSTSFWSSWVPDYWKDSHADYADVHAYVMTTGWIDTITINGTLFNREMLKNDAAAAIYAYSVTTGNDPQRNKPVVLGETDLDMPGNQSPDPLLALDTAGVWLHNFVWGHINQGGMTGLIWNTENIRNNNLYRRYKGFTSFMKNIPLTTGQYHAIDAATSNPAISTWGQVNGNGTAAHFWIRNRNHTWKNVVTSGNPAPQSGIVTISGLTPGTITMERWNSWDEDTIPGTPEVVTVDGSGNLQIGVADLVTDFAVKLYNGSPGSGTSVTYDWPQFQKDASRTGHPSASVAPPFRVRWIWAGPGNTLRNQESEPGWPDDLTSRDGYSFPIPDTVNFTIAESVQPVIKGTRLYFCTMEGNAYALNIDNGETLWSSAVPGGSLVSAAVVGGKVVFASLTGSVYAFDTATGATKWYYDTRGAITTPPCILSNSVIVANHGGQVFRFGSDGNILWEQNLPSPVTGGIAADGNSVYVPAENMKVYAIILASGAIRGSHQVRGQSFRMCHPVVHHGRVWVTSANAALSGSEYIMEEVMTSSASLAEEEQNIKRWLQGDDNGGTWNHASSDWQHIFALDTLTLQEPFLIPAGPVDGCGFPAPSPAVDHEGRILCWWKTRYPKLTATGPAFGTNYSLDVAGINQNTGFRVPIDNGHVAGMFPIETDNLYALSTGGHYLWMRQNFRGTQVIDLAESQHTLVQVTTRYSDGGNFANANICYRNVNQNIGYADVPYLTGQTATMGRTAPAITGNYVFIAETFGIVAIEHH
ncbi:MAG: PQQ-binding-like beta-propeller repeat protein [Bacteroidetes bacterium]|nr:PQQ-binding-like beta-propeller repeat protein [Bacteroidota bacterium]